MYLAGGLLWCCLWDPSLCYLLCSYRKIKQTGAVTCRKHCSSVSRDEFYKLSHHRCGSLKQMWLKCFIRKMPASMLLLIVCGASTYAEIKTVTEKSVNAKNKSTPHFFSFFLCCVSHICAIRLLCTFFSLFRHREMSVTVFLSKLIKWWASKSSNLNDHM